MKKATALALALVLFLLCLPAQAETMMVSTPGGRLNLRAQPDMNAQTLRYIPNGEVVALLERVNATWCKVSWDGSVGYARSQFIAPVEEALQKEYPDAETAYPDALFIYVRAEKDGLAAVVDTVQADTQMTILEDDGNWCHVVYYEFSYYLDGRYLYAAHVSNTTGEAVLAADYTAFVESTVTPRPGGQRAAEPVCRV